MHAYVCVWYAQCGVMSWNVAYCRLVSCHVTSSRVPSSHVIAWNGIGASWYCMSLIIILILIVVLVIILPLSLSLHWCICVLYVYIYIYVYRERKIERDREGERDIMCCFAAPELRHAAAAPERTSSTSSSANLGRTLALCSYSIRYTYWTSPSLALQ